MYLEYKTNIETYGETLRFFHRYIRTIRVSIKIQRLYRNRDVVQVMSGLLRERGGNGCGEKA